MSKEDILRKIKDLLALSDKSRNNSDEEAQAALLMAQKLMAKYDISAEEVDGEEQEQYSHEICEHKWDYAYRIPLAHILSENFRCMVYSHGKKVVFMGHPSDAKICKATFEFAYQYIMRQGSALYNKKYSMGYPTKGVFNSYAHGFLTGLKAAFDVQCKALAIVTPPDVIDKFNDISKDWGTKKTKNIGDDVTDMGAWKEGQRDGKSFMERKQISD